MSSRILAFGVSSLLLLSSCGDSTAPAAATRLVFTAQPTDGTVGEPIEEPIRVAARDAQGNPVPGFTGNVTVALAANPGDATLTGTLTVAAVEGVASFTDLIVDVGEDGYTLTASSGDLTSATSAAFDVAEVAVSFTLEYYQNLDLETGTIEECDIVMCTDADLFLAYNSQTEVHAFMAAHSGRTIAHLPGRAFADVHLADTTGSEFASGYSSQAFDQTGTFLIRTDAGHTYKLGNPVPVATGGLGSVRFDAARLD